jgi:hypothetical protein
MSGEETKECGCGFLRKMERRIEGEFPFKRGNAIHFPFPTFQALLVWIKALAGVGGEQKPVEFSNNRKGQN